MTPVFPIGETESLRCLDFLEGCFDDCLAAYLETRARINVNINRHRSSRDLVPPPSVILYKSASISQKIELLLPHVNPGVTKLLLTQTRGSWCCALANGLHGISSLPHIRMTAEYEQRRYLRIGFSMQAGLENTTFEYYDGTHSPPVERTVYCHNEGGWKFFEHGPDLDFEQPEFYKAKRKKDRLPLTLIEQYCRSLNIDLTESDFYSGECAIITYPAFPATKEI